MEGWQVAIGADLFGEHAAGGFGQGHFGVTRHESNLIDDFSSLLNSNHERKILMKSKLSHISAKGNPAMVSVSEKKSTLRMARARATVNVGKEILSMLTNNEIISKKGPVFQAAIIAGVMGAKRTSDLIPLCHPIGLEDCQVNITVRAGKIVVETSATTFGKTGVEMEALTAASVAALTIYDMCKAMSHGIVIESVMLLEKRGGKSDFIA